MCRKAKSATTRFCSSLDIIRTNSQSAALLTATRTTEMLHRVSFLHSFIVFLFVESLFLLTMPLIDCLRSSVAHSFGAASVGVGSRAPSF